MKIIRSNETLMAYVPNVVETVEGETPLYDKIEQWMSDSEEWACRTFTGETTMDAIAAAPTTADWRHLASLIVADALIRAIPSLDVIVTPNGFGVVSNQNVAPASKERIERLIQQLSSQRDHFINMLLGDLCIRTDWADSEQYDWFAASLLQFPKACVAGAADRIREGKQWDTFLQLRERSVTIEDAIAEKWISSAVMTQLRQELLSGTSAEVKEVAIKVRACVFNELRGNARNHWDLDRITNYIRLHSSLFPGWASSATAQLYDEPTVFKNKKDSPGYFF